jgi:PAS domain S-box-containing protein
MRPGKASGVDNDPAVKVPRYYKYLFLCIFLLAEMTISGWSLTYVNMEQMTYRWFFLNLAISTLVISVILLITYRMVGRAVCRTLAAKLALQRSEEYLQRVADAANDAIVLAGSSGMITYCNPAGDRMFGYAPGELSGREMESVIPAAQRDASLEDYDTHPAERSPDPGGTGTVEMVGVRSDGSEFPVEVSIAMVSDNGQWVTELIVRDISERKTAQATIEQQTEELRNLIDVAAHELRHPATIFKGYSYLLLEKRDTLSPADFDDALRSIDNAATRVTRLVNDLFDASRIERGKMGIKREAVQPGKLITRAVAEMRANGCERDFVLSLRDEASELWADGERIKQVLLILLDNADKFSPENTDVEIWYESTGGEAVFHVADRGPGVPDEKRALLFDRFFQGEDVLHHSTRGIGLGLHIARTIVNAHGGWIEVWSREGGGLDFCFGLPVSGCTPGIAPEPKNLVTEEPLVSVSGRR